MLEKLPQGFGAIAIDISQNVHQPSFNAAPIHATDNMKNTDWTLLSPCLILFLDIC
jgi:hypothetical protein